MRRVFATGWLLIAILVASGCQAGVLSSTLTPLIQSSSMPLVQLDPASGLAFVDLDSLPPEAAETQALIESDGPFPYDQDGAVFQNREGILPEERSDYYHEYTVETPGSPDRGARRIVTGADGQLYWTGDHYDSFQRIRQ